MIDVIEVIEQGPKGDKGDQGDVGPAGATFDQDLNTTDSVAFSSVTAPIFDIELNQNGFEVFSGSAFIRGASGDAELNTEDLTAFRSFFFPDQGGHLALTENTATAAQGALAASAVQPGTDVEFGSVIAGTQYAGTKIDVSGIELRPNDSLNGTKLVFAAATTSADRTHTLPNASGTLALTSDIPTTFAASAISDSTTAGRALLTAADASAQRTSLGLGTAALSASTDFAAATHTHAASAITSGTLDNARINWAAPSAIGGTTPAAGAFTSLSGTSLSAAAGTITASAPFDFSQTWNNAAVTFTGLKLNVTDTASNAASLLLDLQVGGVSKASLSKNGKFTATGIEGAPSFAIGSGGLGIVSAATTLFNANGGAVIRLHTTAGVKLGTWQLGWSASITDGPDLELYRDAANTLAQRNGTNAQESRVYATYTSATNYQRGTVKCVKQTLSALSGASATTTGTFIPDGAVVVGVTTRVGTAITGATSYSVGDGSDVDRWGGSIGVALNTTSDNRDWTAGTVECFTSGGNITLTANGSNFTGGAVEICVFYLAGEAD